MRRYKWLHCRAGLGLAARTKKDVLEPTQTYTNTTHKPLIPGRSILACSWIPMPLRMIRREPSLNAPEQVTSWKQQSQMRTCIHFSSFPWLEQLSLAFYPLNVLLLWHWCIKDCRTASDSLNLYLKVELLVINLLPSIGVLVYLDLGLKKSCHCRFR